MSGYQNLSLFDIALAAALIVVNGALSVALKLDLERKLAWAAVRTVVQLLLIGYVLGWVFAFDRWYRGAAADGRDDADRRLRRRRIADGAPTPDSARTASLSIWVQFVAGRRRSGCSS